MATLAASNVAGVLNGYGAWQDQDDVFAFPRRQSPQGRAEYCQCE